MKKTKNFKTIIISILTFALVFCGFAGLSAITASAADGDACVSTIDCTGTYSNGICSVCKGYEEPEQIEGVYQIGNAGQLYWFAEQVNGGNSTANAILQADIDLAGSEWTTICPTDLYYEITDYPDVGYAGIFDGNNHVIKNLALKGVSGEKTSIGLIGTLSGTVKNLGIETVTFDLNEATDIRAAATVGQIIGGTVSNCYVKGATITPNSYVVGGIAACNYAGLIENCYVVGSTISATSDRFGYIVGDNRGDISETDRKGTVNNCYTDASLYVGGRTGTETNCKAKVSAARFASGEVAGLLGDAFGQNIDNEETKQDYPVLGGAKVYISSPCPALASNSEISEELPHTGSGFCSACGTFIGGALSYVDRTWDEETKTVISETKSVADYTVVDSNTTAMSDGWYVVSGNVTINSNIMIDGTVHLILCDGAELNTKSIVIDDGGRKLYIYAQSTDEAQMGKLTATASTYGYAGIGGPNWGNNGMLVINGGLITATGGDYGAGIGGGQGRNGGNITINGGIVTATGGDYGAGIGGGHGDSGGNITINGGAVTAKGSYDGAGIGGGGGGSGGNITINGGIVTATGGNDGAGIGGGEGGSGGNITINGGTVTATGKNGANNIGSGNNGTNQGIIAQDNTINVYGSVTLGADLTVDTVKTLTVAVGATFTIPEGVTLTNNGTIVNNGTLTNNGTLANNGSINQNGTLVNNGTGTCANDHIYSSDCDTSCELCGDICETQTAHSYTNGICGNDGCSEYQSATSENGVYQIGNAGQLYWFMEYVNSNEQIAGADTPDDDTDDVYSSSANAVLTADIVVNDDLMSKITIDSDGYATVNDDETVRAWFPIGYLSDRDKDGGFEDVYYTGTFDGQGHTVSGLYFNNNTQSYAGLFGQIKGATVKNVGVIHSYVCGNSSIGGVVGSSIDGTVENCYNTGSVIGNYSVGGVMGCNDNGTVTNCYNTGTVTGNYNVGGVMGCNDNGTVTNCYNTGTVIGNSSVGSVVGWNDGTVTNSYYLEGTASVGIGEGSGEATEKSEGEFASGEVAYLLNGSTSEGETLAWGQTLSGENKNAYPVFKTDSNTVYYGYISCAESAVKVYTNNNEATETKPAHDYSNGFCTVCDDYEEPETDSNGVYQIGNAGQLYWFMEYVNSNEQMAGADTPDDDTDDVYSSSANAVLTADIVINEDLMSKITIAEDGTATVNDGETVRAWFPIGYSYDRNNDDIAEDVYYTGTFDGQGHTVSGLYFNNDTQDYVGLFGQIDGATVKNVGVIHSYVRGQQFVGGVVGDNDNVNGTVENCYNTGAVTGNIDVGGVVGYNFNGGTVTNCYNTGSVSGVNWVGGVVGESDGNEVTNSYNTGAVTGDLCVGGVVGRSSGTVTNSYNTGSVNGESRVGGVVGYNYIGSVRNSYNTGSVNGESRVGGVVGYNESSTVTNCYNTGSVTGVDCVGGVVGYFSNGTVTNCYYLEGTASVGIGEGSGEATAKSEGAFAGGEVAYLLNGTPAEGETLVWGQTLSGDSKDAHPVFRTDYNTVYQGYDSCSDSETGYTNSADAATEKPAHTDTNTDHICDNDCGKEDMAMDQHVDTNLDHKCDYGCADAIGTHADENKDHVCDYGCADAIGEHADENKDHVCDYGCADAIGEHADENKDHVCDHGCTEKIAMEQHTDSATDNDHVCDYGCGEALEACLDAAGDNNHACDVCEKADVSAHTYADVCCEVPATCTECGATEGEALGHDWADATCMVPKTCKTCGTTEGEALGHSYDNACDADCNVCGEARTPAEHADADENNVCDECNAELPKDGLSGGAIAGIAIGSVAVVGIGGFSLFWFVIRKKRF